MHFRIQIFLSTKLLTVTKICSLRTKL